MVDWHAVDWIFIHIIDWYDRNRNIRLRFVPLFSNKFHGGANYPRCVTSSDSDTLCGDLCLEKKNMLTSKGICYFQRQSTVRALAAGWNEFCPSRGSRPEAPELGSTKFDNKGG